MKRGWLTLLGIVLLVVGIALAAAGLFVATTVGSDDAVSTAPARVQGSGVAVVAEDVRVDDGGIAVPDGLGSLTLTVRARDGREMFAGVAAPADLDGYLAGAPYDVVVDLSAGSTATTRAVPGTQQPPPPDTVRFWTQSSRGAPAALAARVPAGSTLVVMNADARPGVDADVVVTLRVPHAWRYAWVAVGTGVLLAIVGVVLLWRARAARRRPTELPAPGPALGTTVLPGATPDILSSATGPPAEDLVAPPSDGLAALVVDALAVPADTTIVETTPVDSGGEVSGPVDAADAGSADDTDLEPVESDPADPDADADADGTRAAADPDERPDVATGAAVTASTLDAAETDPVFAALVSAYGRDPVHDDASAVTGAGERPSPGPAEPGPSGPPPPG